MGSKLIGEPLSFYLDGSLLNFFAQNCSKDFFKRQINKKGRFQTSPFCIYQFFDLLWYNEEFVFSLNPAPYTQLSLKEYN